MNFPEDDGTDECGIIRCGCGRAVPCRHCPDTPTPIDPADIRAGDVDWEVLRFRMNWPTPNHMRKAADMLDGLTPARYGDVLRHVADLCDEAESLRRPDAEAEAVEAIRSASWGITHAGERMDPLPGLPEAGDFLAALREQGFDVVRRADS